MKLDRELQKRILEACAKSYPRRMDNHSWGDLRHETQEDKLEANLTYLHQHNLIGKSVTVDDTNSVLFIPGGLYCTEKGMDFLADDGGLSAILGTVTIKIHEDTLRDLLERKILESDTPPEEKNRLVQGLKGLSAEAIKHLTLKLLDQGLARLPEAVSLIGTLLR